MKENLSKNDIRYWLNRVFKHTRKAGNGKDYIDANWSVRVGYEGTQRRIPLGTADRREAARKACQLYRRIGALGWQAALAEFKGFANASRSEKTKATIGEFLAGLCALHASRTKTIEGYAVALRKIAADIGGIPSGGRGGKAENHRLWREKVETLALSTLSPGSVLAWKEDFLARAGTDPIRQRGARVSVNSFLRRARSLFSCGMIELLQNVPLPDPLPFSGIKLEKRSMPRYQSTFDVMALLKDARVELAPEQPEVFKIFVLAVTAGLRRGEIDKLEWSSFNWAAGTISIIPTRYFRTKSEDSTRSVWVPAEVLEIFREYQIKALGQFVIQSEVTPITNKLYDHYRCSTLFEKLISWLRSKGVRGEKPLHSLRKEYGSLIAASYGIHAAKEMLGHADISTTAAHYLEAKGRPTIALGHLLQSAMVKL